MMKYLAMIFIFSSFQTALAQDAKIEISKDCPIERLRGVYKVVSSECQGQSCPRSDYAPLYKYLELGIGRFNSSTIGGGDQNPFGYIKKYMEVPGGVEYIGGFKFFREPYSYKNFLTLTCFDGQRDGPPYSEIGSRHVQKDVGLRFKFSLVFYENHDGYYVDEIDQYMDRDLRFHSKLEKTSIRIGR